MKKRNRKGRRVILHELRDGLKSSFRFLDPRDRGFLDTAGDSKAAAYEKARRLGLRIDRSEREDA